MGSVAPVCWRRRGRPVECEPSLSHAFMRRLNQQVLAQAVPLSGTLALSYRCDLACRMCYCTGVQTAELTVAQWMGILDEAIDAGMLRLVFTGGEPILFPGFDEIYRHVRSRGVMTTLFTNGRLAAEGIPPVLERWRPNAIEVSIYGATPEVSQALTGDAEAGARGRRAVERLHAAGFKVRAKSVITSYNEDELATLRAWAEALDVPYREDSGLMARLDGDLTPLDYRLDPAVGVAREMERPKVQQDWVNFDARFTSAKRDERLYSCGAGRSLFYLEPDGVLRPCLASRSLGVSALEVGFAPAWRQLHAEVTALRLPPDSPCISCDRRVLCGYCPGTLAQEGDDLNDPAAFYCAVGAARREWMTRLDEGEANGRTEADGGA